MKALSLRAAGAAARWVALSALVLSFGAGAIAQAHLNDSRAVTRPVVPVPALTPAVQSKLVWSGADVDGDGQSDFANPTGHEVRACDDYGCGEYGARRDGGGRRHQGVDYDAAAGQAVDAPISGFVSKIGEAYADDGRYRFVEITNPALHYAARVFYVDPQVKEGDAVRLGQPIGAAHSLAPRYPGITNHVHLELFRASGGRRIDSERMITAKWQDVPVTQG